MSPQIDVSQDTFEKLSITAGLMGLSITEVIARALCVASSHTINDSIKSNTQPSFLQDKNSQSWHNPSNVTFSLDDLQSAKFVPLESPARPLWDAIIDALRDIVPDIKFKQTSTPRQIVSLPNFLTLKYQPRKLNIRFSVYGRQDRFGDLGQKYGVKNSRSPYSEFTLRALDGIKGIEELSSILKMAYKNRLGGYLGDDGKRPVGVGA